MDYRTRIRRNQIIAVFLLATFVVGCSGLIGFGNLYKSILFILPFFVLLPTGGYYIIMHFEGRKQFILFGTWIGFVFAVTAIVGMLLDPRTYPVNWLSLFLIAGIIWIGVFAFVILMAPIYSELLRVWKR
jgi:hypothetical protein